MNTENDKPSTNSDPYIEVLENRKLIKDEPKTSDSLSTFDIVLFLVFWAVFTVIFIIICLDVAIHIVLAILIGLVSGFIVALIAMILAKAGVSF